MGVDLELDIALTHPWSNEIEGLSTTTGFQNFRSSKILV